MLPYFRRAERSERGAGEYPGGDGPLHVTRSRPVPPICDAFLQAVAAEGYPVRVDFNGETQEGFGHYDVPIRRGRRWSTASAYLEPARRRLLFDGRRAVGAEVVVRDELVEIRAARETLLAAGVFNSPKLPRRAPRPCWTPGEPRPASGPDHWVQASSFAFCSISVYAGSARTPWSLT